MPLVGMPLDKLAHDEHIHFFVLAKQPKTTIFKIEATTKRSVDDKRHLSTR